MLVPTISQPSIPNLAILYAIYPASLTFFQSGGLWKAVSSPRSSFSSSPSNKKRYSLGLSPPNLPFASVATPVIIQYSHFCIALLQTNPFPFVVTKLSWSLIIETLQFYRLDGNE